MLAWHELGRLQTRRLHDQTAANILTSVNMNLLLLLKAGGTIAAMAKAQRLQMRA